MRNFITPLKSNESALLSGNSKDQKSNTSPKMFEDDLGDDFLTSWKPTKMAIDVDLDLHKVQGPKSTPKTTFASSKMDMDFDFDRGFSKLSGFDFDLSFNSPPSPAKKVKKADPPNKPKHVDADNDLAFDLKGFDTVTLDDINGTVEREKSNESEPQGQLQLICESSRGTATTIIDHSQSENLGNGQIQDTRDATPNVKEDAIPAQPDAKRIDTVSASPSLQPDPELGQQSSQDTTSIMDNENNVHPDCELTSAALGSNVPPVSPTASEKEAADTDTFGSRTGLESEFPKSLNPVLESGAVPVGEQSPRPEENSRTKLSDEDPIPQDLERDHVKQHTSDSVMTLTSPRSSTMLNDQSEACPSVDPRRRRTLQFDPLTKSSQNTGAAIPQPETFGQPADSRYESKSSQNTDAAVPQPETFGQAADSRYESKCSESADETRAKRVENRPRETFILDQGEFKLSACEPPMPVSRRSSGDDRGDRAQKSELQNVTKILVKPPPIIAALSSDDSKGKQKEREEEARASAFNKSSQAVQFSTLGKGRDSISIRALEASIKAPQINRGDHAERKQSMAREDPSLGQVKLKTVPTSGSTGTMVPKHKNTIPNQEEGKLGTFKRPSKELLGTTNKLQSNSQRTSPIHSEEDQGDSGCGTRLRTKRERRQTVRRNVAGFPTALAPVHGTRQGIDVQSAGINTVKAENPLLSRTLTTSRFFATDGPRSTDHVDSPSPEPGKGSRLKSSAACQMKTSTQIGNKNVARAIIRTSEVSRSKGLQISSLSRDCTEIRANGNNMETTLRPQPHSSGRTPLLSSLPSKLQVERHKVQVDRRRKQKDPSLERVDGPVPFGEKVQNQNLPTPTEAQKGHLPAHGSADSLITEDKNIVELSIQQSDKLDAMLKVLRKLNDNAKDLLVRALVANNKLMMLDSPVNEYKKIKKSVMATLGDKQL